MDHRSFDRLIRLLGEATDRRAGVKALLAGLIGAGGVSAALDAEAKRGHGHGKERRAEHRPDADAAQRRRRKKACRPACTGGFSCVKGNCVCPSGVTCGDACCPAGQACRAGACAGPAPACIPAGEPCKGLGRACCDGRVCASGQGGADDVACHVPKTGACAATADCVYGMACLEGRCAPPPPAALGAVCDAAAQQLCIAPGATCSPYTAPDAPAGNHCTLPLRKVCSGKVDCTCYHCSYVNGGAETGARAGRNHLATKACCLPNGRPCTSGSDCCLGLACNAGVCSGTACIPDGGDGCASNTDCCAGLSCGAGGICGAGVACTIERADFADDEAAGAALKALVEDPAGPNPIHLGPGVYTVPASVSGDTFLVVSRGTAAAPLVIDACSPTAPNPVLDGGSTVSNAGPATGGAGWTWTGGKRVMKVTSGAAVRVERIDFRNGNADSGTGGALQVFKGTADLASLAIADCSATLGGGIDHYASAGNPGTLTLTSVTVSGCKATGVSSDREGGALSYMGTGLAITGSAAAPSRFERNYAANTGGGAQIWGEAGPEAIEWLEVEDNACLGEGGGLFFNGSQASTLRNSRIVGNTSGKRGGGIYYQGSAGSPVHDIASTTIADNVSGTGAVGAKDGGGIAVFFCGLTLKAGAVVRGNATTGAGTGAGIFNQGTITCEGSPAVCCNPASGTQDNCASIPLGTGCTGVCATACDGTCPAG